MDEEKEMLPGDFEEEAVESGAVEENGKTKAPAWRPQDAGREDRKMYTRSRVRNAQIPEGTIFYHAKPKPSISDGGEKAVAVYARVSTKSEEQVSSIENQTRYYKEKIARNPDWTMQEIYADEGKTGASMKYRDEFKRMLQDAAEKKMDLILCASVSRFARNMADCMEQIDNLRSMNPSHPVGVYFETENIYTLDPDCNQALSIHAMLADWESDNKSRRMILSYDQRICTGQFPVSDLLGYRHTTDGDLVIQEDEAVTVRFIFLARMDGYSFAEIAEILTERERKTLMGRTDWNKRMVSKVLTNERRWGDLRARKTIVINYKKGKTMKNDGSREGAYVPNHHEAIVSPEIARAVHMLSGARGVDGVPDVGVIDKGGLKGFVNINPCFGGIDRETILQLSNSVYSDEEYARLEREAKIINGDAHSNILSIDFTGYYVPHSAYFIGRDTPTLTISGRRLKFNRKCHERFGGGRNIELLYHPLLQAIIIRTCDDGCGFAWRNVEGSPILNFSAKAFCGAVYEGQDWISVYSFRFRGIMRERGNSKAMIFFLDEPQIVADKAAKKAGYAVAEEQKHLPSRYIPYKNSELKEGSNTEEWKKRRNGMLYAMRKHRDKIVDGLSETDIAEPGVIVENPLIGGIPTRDEIRGELNELLMLMQEV